MRSHSRYRTLSIAYVAIAGLVVATSSLLIGWAGFVVAIVGAAAGFFAASVLGRDVLAETARTKHREDCGKARTVALMIIIGVLLFPLLTAVDIAVISIVLDSDTGTTIVGSLAGGVSACLASALAGRYYVGASVFRSTATG